MLDRLFYGVCACYVGYVLLYAVKSDVGWGTLVVFGLMCLNLGIRLADAGRKS